MKKFIGTLFMFSAGTGRLFSVVVLLFRVVFGVLLMTHGIQKINALSALSTSFPDPLGVGSQVSVLLAIFAEVFCAAAFVLGFLYRLVLVPMMFTMGVAFFYAHGGSTANGGELALLYLCTFALLFLAGAGRYSVDNVIGRSMGGRR